MARYYTMVARDNKAQKWSPQFGDFDRETVEQEVRDQKDSETFKFFKIVSSTPHQKDIDAAVAKLNAKEGEVIDVTMPDWTVDALKAWKDSLKGKAKKQWAYELRCAWASGRDERFPQYGSVLRSIRNTPSLGHEWLDRVQEAEII